jgi:hypothetical protein
MTRRADPEEAFVAALMQDVGMLAMHTALGERYGELLAATRGDHSLLPTQERSALGFSHADAGGRLGERWRLPEQIVVPIRRHHGDAAGPPGAAHESPMVATVVLAYHFSNVLTSRDREAACRLVDRAAAQSFRLSQEQKRRLLYETLGDARELSSLLEVDVGRLPDVTAIMAEADDALMAHQLGVQREAEELRQASRELARAATTDALTGVGNRKLFDEELAERFDESRRGGMPLGLVIADADRFKSLNDTYGHQVGDHVLAATAARSSRRSCPGARGQRRRRSPSARGARSRRAPFPSRRARRRGCRSRRASASPRSSRPSHTCSRARVSSCRWPTARSTPRRRRGETACASSRRASRRDLRFTAESQRSQRPERRRRIHHRAQQSSLLCAFSAFPARLR